MKAERVEGYYPIDGKLYISVTTVTKAIPKPQLDAWKQRKAAESGDKDAAAKEAKKAAYRGTGVHDYIQAFNESTPLPEVKPEEAGYIRGFRSFVETHRPMVTLAEETVRHDAELVAGTLDVGYMMHGNAEGLADYKTVTDSASITKYEPFADNWIQLEAYRRCVVAMGGPWYKYLWVIRLGPDGEFGLAEHHDESPDDVRPSLAWNTFLGAKDMIVNFAKFKALNEANKLGLAASTAPLGAGGHKIQ